MIIKWMLHSIMLCVCSVEDWREKKVSLWKIAVYAGLALGYGILEVILFGERIDIWLTQRILGSIPGIVLLLLGKLSKEAIGYGDGFLVVIIGMSMGFWEGMGSLLTAFFGIFVAAGYIFMKEKRSKGREIAFVPFLLMGMAGAGLWIGI